MSSPEHHECTQTNPYVQNISTGIYRRILPAVHLPEHEQRCCNVRCCKVLSAPLSRCIKCQRDCYCSKDCQRAAWREGHKRECGKAAALELYEKIFELYEAENWPGLLALEETASAASAAAETLRKTTPDVAVGIYQVLCVGYKQLGKHAKSLELNKQGLAIAVEAGKRESEGTFYCDIGSCYEQLREYAKAIQVFDRSLAISEELGNRANQGATLGNLSSCYEELGQYAKAIELYEQCLKIHEEIGARKGTGRTLCNLAICYESLQQYDTAITLLEKARVIMQEVGDRDGEVICLAALGICKTALGDYEQAILCHTEQWCIAKELAAKADEAAEDDDEDEEDDEDYAHNVEADLAPDQAVAALNLGIVIWAQARAEHGTTGAAATTPRARYTEAYMASMHEATQWLETALRLSHGLIEQEHALLHLSFVAFDMGDEDDALYFLGEYLDAQMVCVGGHYCGGCGQKRGDDAPMLNCGGCKVARFCSEDHQRMASTKGGRKPVRHKDICSLLGEWKEVVKERETGDAVAEADDSEEEERECYGPMLEFLGRDVWWRCHALIK